MNLRRKILFFAASPSSHSDTEWSKEYMAVRTVLEQSDLKRKYYIDLICRATADIISEQIPTNCWLIHFSGHGKEGGKIFLEDEMGSMFIPRSRDLMEVLSASNEVKCFLFNSCYSDKLAFAAKDYVDYAIGITGEINNLPAIDFVEYFYKSFAKYETIPMAYKDAKRKLSLDKKEGIETVFECRNSAIMELVLQGRQEQLQQLCNQDKSLGQEIDVINNEIAQLNEQQKGLLSGLLRKNPHPLGVAWFIDSYEQLAFQVGNKILSDKSEEERDDFSQEVSYLFGLLKACMVLNDNLYSGEDLNTLKSGNFSNTLFEKAFDEIPHTVPDIYNTRDFVPFLRDHIKHIKSLL